MTAEQIWSLVGFILGAVIMGSIVYYTRRRKFRFPIPRLFFALSPILLAITMLIQGGALWVFFAWTSCVLTLSVVFEALEFIGRELNEKLALSLMLTVVVAGGIPANVYVFSMSTGWLPRILSLSMLILIVAPILVGLIAHSIGKRKFSKKLIKTLFLKRKDDIVLPA